MISSNILNATSNTNGLILTVDDDTSENKYLFTNDPTKIGTNNCATHPICSVFDMFTNMRSANYIGKRT